ncbi:hypothetical protein SASPL_152317 [Salvia splendens]|uniref:NAF domain-containing protein n=1 Tax=Salvia splendens TaxID=180675 RepID=A0A8X8YZX7_SALSN|nr:hypothetical protein SASPL_152317 [Salvia splendens]
MENSWFMKGFKHVESLIIVDVSDSRRCGFGFGIIRNRDGTGVHNMNAFDLISMTPGFDLSGLFEGREPGEGPRVVHDEGAAGDGGEEGAAGDRRGDLRGGAVVPYGGGEEVLRRQLEYVKFCDQESKPSFKDIVWSWEGNNPS